MSMIAMSHQRPGRHDQGGLGLIELMIAIVLGMLVAGSAVAIFSTNRDAYAATESVGRIQENARIAYEMMARDLREAGGTPCASRTLPMANVTTGGKWWQTWGNGSLVGYNQGATGLPSGAPSNMVTLGDAIVALESDDTPLSVVSHDNAAGTFTLNTAPTGFSAGDIVVACDYRQASMFQINGVTAGSSPPYTISYGTGGLNCTKDMSIPVNCASGGNGIKYAPNAMVGRLRSVAWYIKANNHGGTSLFQAQLNNGATQEQEIVEGVTAMKVTYLKTGGTAYVDAAGVGTGWSDVIAVRVSLTLQGGATQEHVSTTGYGALTRTIVQTISLRNHLS